MFAGFQPLAAVTQTSLAVLGLVIFVNFIQLAQILQLSWHLRIVARILTIGAVNFRDLLIQFGLFIWAFTQFYYFHLGARRSEYATAIRTLEAMIALFLGGGSSFKTNIAVGDDMTAQLFIFIYGVFIIIMWTNLFIATLVDLFHDATEDVKKEATLDTFDPIVYFSHKLITIKSSFLDGMHMLAKSNSGKDHTK